MRGVHHPDMPLCITPHDQGRGVTKSVAVARLHPCDLRLHRIQKRRTARCFAAVVRHQQQVGVQIGRTLGCLCCDLRLLRLLNVTGQ